MRIFNIKSIDFYGDMGSIDFSIYQVPFTLMFSNTELEGMDDYETTMEICERLRELFGYHDVDYLDYYEVFTYDELFALTKSADEIKIDIRKRKMRKLILNIYKKKI